MTAVLVCVCRVPRPILSGLRAQVLAASPAVTGTPWLLGKKARPFSQARRSLSTSMPSVLSRSCSQHRRRNASRSNSLALGPQSITSPLPSITTHTHTQASGYRLFRIELVDEPAEQVPGILETYGELLAGRRSAADAWRWLEGLTDANGRRHGVGSGSLEPRKERPVAALKPTAASGRLRN